MIPRNILLTGGCGFIGANLATHLKQNLPESKIICFDNFSRQGSELNAQRLQDIGIHCIKGDIRNPKEILGLSGVHLIIDCCANPSVLAAIQSPLQSIETNLMGTVYCLELARQEKAGMIFLSTSRVYPIEKLESLPFDETPSRFDWPQNLSQEGVSFQGVNEQFPLTGPRSLYGSSKLCSEHILLEYLESFSLTGVINRLGVVAGPWQMGRIDQGIVGYWVSRHKFQQPLSYIGFGGSGKQVRDCLHVQDVCDLILLQIKHLKDMNQKIFNAGGGRKNSCSLLELTTLVQSVCGTKLQITSVPETRPSDTRIYISDNTLIQKETGWTPKRNLTHIVEDVSDWIDEHKTDLKEIFFKT